jgi:5'-phosphate synthase pdxT subunit
MKPTRIGILALQGSFLEHKLVLQRLNAEPVLVRLPEDLQGLKGLIIPGGESTTISRLMMEANLFEAIGELALEKFPILGSCAGMIMLGREKPPQSVKTLGAIDIEVKRNAFGRQVDSFETDLSVPVLGREPFHAIFIRSPIIDTVGSTVEVLARLPEGTPVAAREGRLLATAFHPELTEDLRFHRFFLDLASDKA